MKNPRRVRLGATGALLFACAVFVAACSGTIVTPPEPNPGPTGRPVKIGHGAFFVPVLPPFSPNTPYTLAGANGANASPTTYPSPASDHWFYLVNGYQLQTPVPGVPGSAPVPQTTPFVLGVDGPLPQGAPGPNGGVTAGTAGLGSISELSTLWKVVQVTPGSTSKTQRFFLRSAQSFLPEQPWVGTTPIPSFKSVPIGTYPSILTGFGAQAVNLDLGAASGLNAGVYMNQATWPFQSGQTSFQQWYYDTATQSVNNAEGGILAQTCTPVGGKGCVGLVPGATGPTSRWYAYPNYLLSAIVAEPTSGPAFPQPSVTTAPHGYGRTDVNGENAAYYYISIKAFGGKPYSTIQTLPKCSIPGEPGYGPDNLTYGIRCQYINVNSTGQVESCVVASNDARPLGPQPYNPNNPNQTTAITAADWAVVSTHMYGECTYAESVMNTFAAYDGILKVVFSESSNAIGELSGEIQATQRVTITPLVILRGIVYTALSAGGPVSGILANLMQTTIDWSQARKSNLANPISVTASTLYGDVNSEFINDQKNEDYIAQTVLWSWQRLKQVGPLAEQDGPNGLGMAGTDQTAIEEAAVAGYQTVFLQIFYPQAYGVLFNPAQTSASGLKAPSYDTYAYPTFGQSTKLVNANAVCSLRTYKTCPSSGLMAAPTPLPVQSRFALFNGFNGWSAMPRGSYHFQCQYAITVIFNGTPNTLTVEVTPTNKATVASPNGWTGSAYSVTLNPYGYVPIYSSGPGLKSPAVGVTMSSGSASVGSFTFSFQPCQDGGQHTHSIYAQGVSTAAGWSFYPPPQNGQYPSSSPNLQNPIYNNYAGPQLMWVLIQ